MKPLHLERLRPLLALAVLACGNVARAEEAADELKLVTPGSAVIIRVTDRELTSADVQLSRDEDALRGRAYGGVLFVELQKDAAQGVFGSQPTRLRLTRKADGFEASGLFAGSLTRLRFGPEEIAGNVGSCGYTLRWNGAGRYEGSRSCGGPTQPVSVTVPPTLLEQGPVMTAVALALLLAD